MTTDLHLAMHGVAIKKSANASAVASAVKSDEGVVSATLSAAVASGRVLEADGNYLLSPAGQMILLSEYSRFYGELRHNEGFLAAYEQFERINTDLKTLMTDWQTMDVAGKQVPNDHSNADYDEKIIDRLGDLHEKFEPILKKMCDGVARFSVYQDKLGSALEKAEDGDTNWVSDAKSESYHTVWFEMHEDLLRLMGREREE